MKEPRKSPPRKSHAKAEEKLDEAIEESFPASDPPANTPTSVGGPVRAKRPAPGKPRATRLSGGVAPPARYAVARITNAPPSSPGVSSSSVTLTLLTVRESWPLAHFGDERFDSGGRTADQRLDCAVVSVAHPAGNAQAQRRAAGELPIADALDGAVDQDTPDDGASFGHGALLSPWTMRPDRRGRGREMRRRS